jgi:outer membrane protein assembly factor BamB
VVDGAALVVYGSGDLILVTAREAADGARRFTRWYSGKGWRPAAVLPAGRLVLLVGAGVSAGDVVALDTRTGEVRWTWRPERDGGPCDVDGAASAGGVLGLALRCRAAGVADVVVGLSAPDGRQKWEWRPPYSDALPRGAELSLVGADGGFFVRFGATPRRAVLLDPAGAPGTAFQSEGDALAAGLLYVARDDGGEATSVDPRSGARRWRTSLTSLIGWRPIDTALTAKRVYLLLTTLQPETASGPLHLVALDRASGAVIGNHDLSCTSACTTSTITADDHSAVVATAGSLTAF